MSVILAGVGEVYTWPKYEERTSPNTIDQPADVLFKRTCSERAEQAAGGPQR